MKIVHVCLSGPFNDNWNYQDNIISEFHHKAGHDVTIITSVFINSLSHSGYEKVNAGEYILDNGVKIIRIPFKACIVSKIVEKLRIYSGLKSLLNQINPDFLFIHGLQFIDMYQVVKYLKKNSNTKVIVDNHADFSNSARNWLSKNILHKVIWRRSARLIEPYCEKFYGVLPARVDFLKNIYKIPENKVDLLVMGADDEKVTTARDKQVRSTIRKRHNIGKNDFLIMTGGKIDSNKKETLNLMEAVRQLNNSSIKLLVFGSVIKELEDELNYLADGATVQYIGWVDPEESYNYFGSADLVVFPGRHSVFWEQVVGLGVPCVFRYWDGTTHIDLGGNCEFLYNSSTEEIVKVLSNIIHDKDKLNFMKQVAISKGMDYFSYRKIAMKALEV